MPKDATPSKWYYRDPKSNEAEGPVNLIELAGLLATGDITSETPIRDGEFGNWQAFRERREFQTAKDMPPDVILRHIEAKNPPRDYLFPLKWLYSFGCLVGAVFLYTIGVWFYSHFPLARNHSDANDWLMLLLRKLLHIP